MGITKPSRRPSIEQLLDDRVGELDQVMAEVRGGIRSASHYNDLEARVKAIASGLTGAFRKGRVG